MSDEQPSLSPVKNLVKTLVVGLESTWPSPQEWTWLQQYQPHGVILFSRNVSDFPQLQTLCLTLKSVVPGLQIMADHEGGPVSQLAAALGQPPAARTLGHLDDPELTTRVHQETGRRLKIAGIDMVLGPCADVLSEPRNPVIGVRSFGAEPAAVARQVVASVQGLQQAGVQVCLKHWPGHGSSRQDSHLESTVVHLNPGEIEVFRAGLSAGARWVMPGHLLTETGSGLPATLSRDFLHWTRLQLDQEMTGLKLIADDISMGALRPAMDRLGVKVSGDPGSGMLDVHALPLAWFQELAQAGCDLFLIRGIPWGAFPLQESSLQKAPDPVVGQEGNDSFDGQIYSRVRRQASVHGFADPQSELALLDCLPLDRWQVASAQGRSQLEQFHASLERRFQSIVSIGQNCTLDHSKPVKWLLIRSHRPLSQYLEETKNPLFQGVEWAPEGHCLVMGHPSLAASAQQLLGRGWTVTYLFDVGWRDLDGV